MRLGIVLAKTPSYSETFFISKIKGLQDEGFKVTLFVQSQETSFNLCPVKKSPRVFKKNIVFQAVFYVIVLFKLMIRPKVLQLFLKLEKQSGRSWKQILKNLYNNAHILTADLDWLHFGFTTLAIQSEHLAKAIGAKMAVSLRGFDIAIYTQKYSGCYNILWQKVDKVHAISDDLYYLAIDNGLSSKKSFQKITPAIDVKKFNRDLIPDENSKTDLVKFLTVGRLHWKKGLIDTIEALALLKNQGVNFTYTIVGEGGEFEAISFAIYQLKLSEQITLIGKRDHEEIAKLMNQCDVYLQYSISEGFCNAVLEAQAMGCLCVVSDAEGLQENVLHNKTGWVVQKRNPKLFANVILEVIHLPELLKFKIRSNAKERVIHDFNLEKQRKEFAEFYKF